MERYIPKTTVKNVQCPYCGGKDIIYLTAHKVKCDHCGSELHVTDLDITEQLQTEEIELKRKQEREQEILDDLKQKAEEKYKSKEYRRDRIKSNICEIFQEIILPGLPGILGTFLIVGGIIWFVLHIASM